MTDPPPLALAVFGDRLALAVRYSEWLAGAGVERGLIGPRETDRLWERHLLNCAAVAALIPPRSSVVDIGSGAGLPGVVLAIARPDLRITLVEPMLRRTVFLESVVADLGLAEVKIHRARADDLPSGRSGADRGADRGADCVTARAVASIDRLAVMASPLLRPGGDLLAIKGTGARAELATGWAGVKRANMTRAVALFSVSEAGASEAGASEAGASEADNPSEMRSASWLSGVEVTCLSRWTVTDSGPLGPEPEDDPERVSPPHSLALVLRLGRGTQLSAKASHGGRELV